MLTPTNGAMVHSSGVNLLIYNDLGTIQDLLLLVLVTGMLTVTECDPVVSQMTQMFTFQR